MALQPPARISNALLANRLSIQAAFPRPSGKAAMMGPGNNEPPEDDIEPGPDEAGGSGSFIHINISGE